MLLFSTEKNQTVFLLLLTIDIHQQSVVKKVKTFNEFTQNKSNNYYERPLARVKKNINQT